MVAALRQRAFERIIGWNLHPEMLARLADVAKEAGLPFEEVLVDIYADEAITGTAMDKRDDLNRMLTDCRKGKIDKVLIKAIHRLARNTADCLTIIRDLPYDRPTTTMSSLGKIIPGFSALSRGSCHDVIRPR